MAVIYYRGIRKSCIFIAALFAIFLSFSKIREPVCRADEQANVQEQSLDFTSLSLEELKQVMIISVLKKPEKLTEATSAISIITQEDIRRSGATSIPELLRRVPGFQVAQMSSNTWAVSARGFNNRYANKLLVLMDGRSLYTPLFSGVYWDVQDIFLEDVERIEVIRGPGATLWGANAVNGVINIITRKAKDTQGGLVTSGLGNELRRFGVFRYGGRWGDNAFGRIYLQYSERDSLSYTSGDEGNDQWDSLRGGFRIDRSSSESDLFTLLGDIYQGQDGDKMIFSPPPSFDPNLDTADTDMKSVDLNSTFLGGYLLGRWQHRISNTSDMTAQLYYDRTQQEKEYSSNSQYRERFDVLDFDFQHSFKPAGRHEIIWGLGYRFISDHFEAKTSEMPVFILDPASRQTDIISAFVQDGMDIIDDKLQLIAGSKLEHNDYTGFEIQPSLRLLLKLSRAQNLWTSISRAVRTPSRLEYDPVSEIGIDDPNKPHWPTSGSTESEKLIAYELGYRLQPAKSFSLDIASFYNVYEDLIPFEAEAETQGVELAADWDFLKWWHLNFSYTYLHMHFSSSKRRPSPSPAPPPPDSEEDDNPPPPQHSRKRSCSDYQFLLHSSMNLPRGLEFDLDLRYVDKPDLFIDSYAEMDVRLGWSPRRNLEFSIVGRNLLHNHHPEFLTQGYIPRSEEEDIEAFNLEIGRSIYGKITCQF